MGRKRKARGLESEGKGHCGFLWPPLLVNKPGRVKLDKRKRPYKQCDHLEWRGGGWVEGGSARRARRLPVDAEPCGSDREVSRGVRGSLMGG